MFQVRMTYSHVLMYRTLRFITEFFLKKFVVVQDVSVKYSSYDTSDL